MSHLPLDERAGSSYQPTGTNNATLVRTHKFSPFLNAATFLNSSQHNLIHMFLFSAHSLWLDAFQALMSDFFSRWWLDLKANSLPDDRGWDPHAWYNHPTTGILSKECVRNFQYRIFTDEASVDALSNTMHWKCELNLQANRRHGTRHKAEACWGILIGAIKRKPSSRFVWNMTRG